MADNSLEKVVTITYDENGNFIGGCFNEMVSLCEQNLRNIVGNSKTWNLPLDNLVDGFYIFATTQITSWDIPLLNLGRGYGMFERCSNLETFDSPLPKLGTMNFSDGFMMFHGCKLPADNINKILTSLPRVSGNQVITFTGCPGAPTCDPSIGTNKGWTVQV